MGEIYRLRKVFFLAELFVLSYALVFSMPVSLMASTVDTYQINASRDDAWSTVNNVEWNGAFYNISQPDMIAGCRWEIDIPKGAIIEHAYFICKAKSTSQPGPKIRIQVFDQNSCDEFDVIFWDWPVMPEYVDWNLPAFTANNWYTSPDLKTIVQAYIDRPGYNIGNYLGLKFAWQSGQERVHEVWAWDSNPDDAAKLEIAYSFAPFADFTFSPGAPIAEEITTFNASTSFDPDGNIINYFWDFGDGMNATGMIVTHNYSAAGIFNVTLTVNDNDGFSDSVSKMVTVYMHDIKIVTVSPSATDVPFGRTVNITVIVENKGTVMETFNVTLYLNNTAIETQTVSNLSPNAQTTLIFRWNTTEIESNSVYIIKAEAEAVPGENNTDDNVYIGENIKVSSQSVNSIGLTGLLPYLKYVIPTGILLVGFSAAGVFWKKRESSPKYVGLEFFDEITGGGIPGMFSVMINGDAGSGKSVLCQQLAYNFLTKGDTCVYITYDCFPDEVRKNMKELNWDTSTYEKKGNLKFIDGYSHSAGVVSQEDYQIKQPSVLSELGIAISEAMNIEKQKSTKVFLDSTVPLFTESDPIQVIKFLGDRSARIKGEKGSFFFVVGEGTVESGYIRKLEEIVDCVIELRVSEAKGKTLRKMRVKKMRGRSFVDTWISFDIKAKKGIVFSVPKNRSKFKASRIQ